MCRKDDDTLLTVRNKGLKAKSIFNFILYGPSPEALKEVINKVNSVAHMRSKGYQKALVLFLTSHEVDDKAEVLRIVARAVSTFGRVQNGSANGSAGYNNPHDHDGNGLPATVRGESTSPVHGERALRTT